MKTITKTIIILIITIAINLTNFVLGFWAMGKILEHWELTQLLFPLTDFKVFMGIVFVLSIFSSGKSAVIGTLIAGSDEQHGTNKSRSLIAALTTTILLLLSILMSFIYSRVFELIF